ncbi:MAG: MFS transporter [Brevirhabdus sp.]
MTDKAAKKRIWGWMMFDWASQPYNTLLLTFIFGPYFASAVVGDPVQAQSLWGFGIGAAGICIAILAPLLGAIADGTGRRMPWIKLFSVAYVIGAFGLWWAVPDTQNVTLVLIVFGIGLIGMEFATIFTNAMLPELGPREDIGRISGSGWAMGYVGGMIALVFMLLFMAESEEGKTLLGSAPLFGLDPVMREGTRSVGPITALWFIVFMIPFFMWVKEPLPRQKVPPKLIRRALKDLKNTLKGLPRHRSLSAYLLSSMFYRDALNGMYTFGGIYAAGVLGWTVVDVGIFGILAIVTGAIFAWLGGHADKRFGPKPVILIGIVVLLIVSVSVTLVSRGSVFGVAQPEGSSLPDIAFYILGALIGAAGGALQSASRTMLVHQANPDRMTEAFGLYALAGKATAFLAPTLIGLVTAMSESQRIGVVPVACLFLVGLILLIWVKPNGEHDKWSGYSQD